MTRGKIARISLVEFEARFFLVPELAESPPIEITLVTDARRERPDSPLWNEDKPGNNWGLELHQKGGSPFVLITTDEPYTPRRRDALLKQASEQIRRGLVRMDSPELSAPRPRICAMPVAGESPTPDSIAGRQALRRAQCFRELWLARLEVFKPVFPEATRFLAEEITENCPIRRGTLAKECIKAYFAEIGPMLPENTFLEWQQNNPVSIEWYRYMAERVELIERCRPRVDLVDHELAFNWRYRENGFEPYCEMTAAELAEVIFEKTQIRLTPEAIKKRRERLGLTTDRTPGPPPVNSLGRSSG